MIFVTVGTDTHDFSRLVQAMDEIARTRKVVIQTGHTRYRPRHAAWFAFEDEAAIEDLYRKADVIVTHAGAGSIIRSLSSGKVPVVVPRLRERGEHINDHQLDLARGLGSRGAVVAVEDVSALEKALTARKARPRPGSILLGQLEEYVTTYEKGQS